MIIIIMIIIIMIIISIIICIITIQKRMPYDHNDSYVSNNGSKTRLNNVIRK